MSFLLVRVDDRLLHGQVVFAWGQALAPRAYLIVDDEVAGDPWERESFQAAGAPETPVSIWSLADFLAKWPTLPDPQGTVVLLRGLPQLARLAEAGFRPPEGVNLGGLHGAGCAGQELLPYLHLTADDGAILSRLLASDYPLYAQDLPSSPRHGARRLGELIGP